MQNSYNFMFNNQPGVNSVVNITGLHSKNLSSTSWAKNSVAKLQYHRDDPVEYFGGTHKTSSLTGLYNDCQNRNLFHAPSPQ